MRHDGAARASVLHVPYTYFPDACGGTEVYVRALARGLGGLGFPSAIAAPGHEQASYQHDGLAVHRFAIDRSARRELAYGAPDEIAAHGFATIVAELRPGIVHLHARTAAVSERLVEIAHAAGARVVFTYHTPTVSCARGTMMLFGDTACDGVNERRRCAACVLASHGVPRALAGLVAGMPDGVGAMAAAFSGVAKPLLALQVPALTGQAHDRFHRLMTGVDHVVAVCQWVRDVLVRNGVARDKITLSRQGLADVRRPPEMAEGRTRKLGEPLKIAYFGRIDAAKGPDLLGRALELIPQANVALDIYAISGTGRNRVLERLDARAARDRRVRMLPAVAPDDVVATMAGYDVIAVPSRWLETGPLVVLEAFAAGVPVLGANLGGIAELVTDGRDGRLVAPDDPGAWAAAIEELCADTDATAGLRGNIAPPRSIARCAEDMAGLYARLLRQADRPDVPPAPVHAS